MASAPPAFNVAVVGYGLSAKVFHIPLILALPEEYKLFGVVQRSPKPDDDASKDHPGIKSWRSVDAVYQDKDVDLVVITTVPSTHFEMCKDALEAGKHVVVEKPFVPTAAEAERLIEVAKAARKTLTVYQNRRWDSDFLTLRKVMADGLLGDIAEFQSHFDRHRPDPPPDTWKSVDAPGHGAVYDLGSHLIDQVYHTFGMPKSVTGFVGNQRRGVEGGAPDSCTVLLHYDQLLATCKAGVVSPEEEQLRFWVRGTSGSFKKFQLDPQEPQLRSGMRATDAGFGIEPESHHGTLTTVSTTGAAKRATCPTVSPPPTYIEFYRLLAQALRRGGPVPVPASDARDVLEVIELAVRSSSEGRTIRVS